MKKEQEKNPCLSYKQTDNKGAKPSCFTSLLIFFVSLLVQLPHLENWLLWHVNNDKQDVIIDLVLFSDTSYIEHCPSDLKTVTNISVQFCYLIPIEIFQLSTLVRCYIWVYVLF